MNKTCIIIFQVRKFMLSKKGSKFSDFKPKYYLYQFFKLRANLRINALHVTCFIENAVHIFKIRVTCKALFFTFFLESTGFRLVSSRFLPFLFLFLVTFVSSFVSMYFLGLLSSLFV